MIAVAAVVVVLLACCGVGGYFTVHAPKKGASSSVVTRPSHLSNGASAEPETTTEAEDGPQASPDAPEEIDDLDQVCDHNMYFPQLPKRAGKAPHPVAVLIDDDGGGIRHQSTLSLYDLDQSKAAERTWEPKDPKTVQMVACLDRTSTGSTIRKCRFDDPKPDTVSLQRATWRLRVYETASGRTLLSKTMPGNDTKCPSIAFVGPDKKIYAGVTDRTLIASLRKLVMK